MPDEPRSTGARGQTVPLMAIVLLLAGLLLVPLGLLIRATEERARAQSAADAAALAGALAGEDEAASIAAANGGRLTDYREEGPEIEVRVVVGSHEAWAKAERRVTWVAPAP